MAADDDDDSAALARALQAEEDALAAALLAHNGQSSGDTPGATAASAGDAAADVIDLTGEGDGAGDARRGRTSGVGGGSTPHPLWQRASGVRSPPRPARPRAAGDGESGAGAAAHAALALRGPEAELKDPTPNIYALFAAANERFFEGRLSACEVKWSPRMTLCAGVCSFEGHGGLCSIRLSKPLLSLRPRSDLINTLLHEAIHAYLFVTGGNQDRDGHGPDFQFHAARINDALGCKITIYHTFHDEVESHRGHHWQCDGPCRQWKPFFGIVKRAMNRAPSPRDPWWERHQSTCGGTWTKIREPEGYQAKRKGKVKGKDKSKPAGAATAGAGDANGPGEGMGDDAGAGAGAGGAVKRKRGDGSAGSAEAAVAVDVASLLPPSPSRAARIDDFFGDGAGAGAGAGGQATGATRGGGGGSMVGAGAGAGGALDPLRRPASDAPRRELLACPYCCRDQLAAGYDAHLAWCATKGEEIRAKRRREAAAEARAALWPSDAS
uniref:SprT-like domain-containing protein n=1 Tax=Bicosoecida sp. CB-2014 TaxID=1486930 RepID=A0A7S1C475_9STRA|mmetsp:Transcript_11234/g.39109  ORF Transcript_11234/g.39109 Transcript_11234/m.39109 type:complete len:496 (+) Transcript_11234:138-1625(+)